MTEAENVGSGGEEDFSKYKGDKGIVQRWLKEIDLVKHSKAQNSFEKVGEKIIKIYKNAELYRAGTSASSTRVMFNILWSNVQVLKPTLYARMPKVVVERRFKDSDPIGRLACDICERATTFMLNIQQDRFNYAVKSAVEDRLLPGRGQVWLRFDAEFIDETDESGDPVLDENGNAKRIVKPNSEKVVIDPLHWLDYFEAPSRNPYEVRWKAKQAYMNRASLIKRFGSKIGKEIELNYSSGDNKRAKLSSQEQEFLMQAIVYEFWDNESKRVYWISEGYKEGPLDVKEDPLRLNEFFPCPMPLLATTTTDSQYPTADYKIYERLADELDYITKRISSIIECIRIVGLSAASLDREIRNMLKLDDGRLWPLENWATFVSEKGGLDSAINWFPFERAAQALEPLMNYQQSLLQQIFEIVGIPDIVRGSSDPTETLGAQQQKAHWTIVKGQEKQADVQRFCREIISRVSEIIFEPGLFADGTIGLMCGVSQLSPDKQANYMAALSLLRDDRLRTFRVDIETDSTIAIDEEQNMENWMNYNQSIQSLVSGIQNVVQFRPELVHPMIESALAAVRTLRTGRSVEGAWEKAMKQIEDNDAQAQANPQQQPDYQGMQIQLAQQQMQINQQDIMTKGQTAQMKAQIDGQELQFKQQIEGSKLQLESQKMQMDFEIESKKIEVEAQKVMNKAQIDSMMQELEIFRAKFEVSAEEHRQQIEAYRVQLTEKEKFMEESRLKQEQTLEAIRLVHERAKESAESNGQSKTPVIHVHNTSGSKEIMMQRLPTGELVGRTREVENG